MKKLSIATLIALGFGLAGNLPRELGLSPPRPPKPRRWSKPHQGAREMARRRGGADWLRFRNAERANRGLPALEG